MSLKHSDYTVAWIAALHIELAPAIALLDERHNSLPLPPGDTNVYTLGRLGQHNVVVANLPDGGYGTTPAATVAANLLRSFPNIKFGLMVGIGGGVPGPYDLRLGDIVVASPTRDHGGVIQYDFGATVQNHKFVRRGCLNRPPRKLLDAAAEMRADADAWGYNFQRHFDHMLEKHARMRTQYERPLKDDLFHADYIHLEQSNDCGLCSSEKKIPRKNRHSVESQVFYGTIGSANQVLRDAHTRDELNRETGIMCFEMEAAGLVDSLPCLVIRGISDYADSHKNKDWQPYASAIAAAFAKELLLRITPAPIARASQKHLTIEAATMIELANRKKDERCLRDLRQTDPQGDKLRIKATIAGSWNEPSLWLRTNDRFQNWKSDLESQILCVAGDNHDDRTMLVGAMTDVVESNQLEGMNVAYFFLPGHSDSKQMQLSNTGTAVLRGLMFMLLKKNPELIKYVREEYDYAGGALFEDINSWYVLSDIFGKILEDPLTNGATFFVDALDVCDEYQEDLLQLIIKFAYSTRTRWVVSLSFWKQLEKQLQHFGEGLRQSSELTAGPSSLQLCYVSVSESDHQGQDINERE